MDLDNLDNRLMLLQCMRENASNMRIEQQQLRENISNALMRARNSLDCIRALSAELIEMKAVVESALAEAEEARNNVEELGLVETGDEGRVLAEGIEVEESLSDEQIRGTEGEVSLSAGEITGELLEGEEDISEEIIEDIFQAKAESAEDANWNIEN
ncbi:uncharacterized protein LOC133842069 [Drosophila sulfurigaster albostrigata]|uniref:uncharacterized protein LOC133842069 n=1 Tax=Drosophila sulfurigaster albostrigata TaxID=89887 RepID=UPI002D21AA36|nr:uncharacterized protein LOC133842069 [Drosophila sulfurigaster albostrigata]